MSVTINGKYSSATVFTTDNPQTALEKYARVQLENLCNNQVSSESTIRVMPDVHPGKICTIGLTMTLGKTIMPQLLGMDIGCGVTVAKVAGVRKEWQRLDSIIRGSIPSGFERRKTIHRFAASLDLTKLDCYSHLQKEAVLLSLGTLGGGNHFIEVDSDSSDSFYLMVHSGSRSLGAELSTWYQNAGHRQLQQKGMEVPYELTYLEGSLMQSYLGDLKIAQDFAAQNRMAIISDICKGMKWKTEDIFESVHNYVDFSQSIPILRKGAISAKKDERVVIPANMKDGAILGLGKGNADWNFSAPHGSGRILKRDDVKKNFYCQHLQKRNEGHLFILHRKGNFGRSPLRIPANAGNRARTGAFRPNRKNHKASLQL
ncbi:MAG: RtcB family protein [Treponema sp.]|nr:RtcB family protein [Treponema sp.]